MTKKIKVTISPLGKPTVEAIGFNGIGCTEATEGIERALSGGSGGFTREYKPEYSNSSNEQETVKQGW